MNLTVVERQLRCLVDYILGKRDSEPAAQPVALRVSSLVSLIRGEDVNAGVANVCTWLRRVSCLESYIRDAKHHPR